MKSSLLQLHTEPLIIEREWESDGIPVLSATVSIPHPVSSEGGVGRRIRRFYDLQARAFLRYCDRWLFPEATAQCQAALAASAPLPQFHAHLDYHITYNEGGFWSLYTQSCEPDPSGHPMVFRHGDTWDLTTGYPTSLNSFFSSPHSLETPSTGTGRPRDSSAGTGRNFPLPSRVAQAPPSPF